MDTARPYILVVDDLADSADSLAEVLTLWGYDAEPLDSGAAALDAACARRPDAVLLDLVMPRMSGLQFALCFRDVPGCGAVPGVAVTGYERLRLEAREVSIDHYLLKPVDFSILQELLGRITASTARSRSRAEPRRPRYARLTGRSLS